MKERQNREKLEKTKCKPNVLKRKVNEGRALDKASFMCVWRHHAGAVLWVGND